MGINIFQIDAFTKETFGGNPAGVVPDARRLSQEDMENIAREMNLSETAFIKKLDDDLFQVRFFTPLEEVELCGHATIGAFYVLAHKRYISPIENGVKTINQITKAGRLPVYIHYEAGEVSGVYMVQASPKKYGRVKSLEDLAQALNIRLEDIGLEGTDLREEIVSTGLKDILLPLRTKEALDGIRINRELLSQVSRDNDVVGVHAYYMEDTGSHQVYTRNFAPLVGIDEESATGTSNGALLYFLNNQGLLADRKILAYQGESLNRPSQIQGLIDEEGRIMIGGQARLVIDGILSIR